MKALAVVLVLVAAVAPARADDFAKYAGQVVISPDPVPTGAGELPKWLAANATKDRHYELLGKWDINLAGVLSKDPGTRQVMLVIVEKLDNAKKSDKPPEPLISIELSSKRKIVAAHTTATVAAGFAAGKLYAVEIRLDQAVLASADLTLRK